MHLFLKDADCKMNILYYGSRHNFENLKCDIYFNYILKNKDIGRDEFLAKKVITELWGAMCSDLIDGDYEKSDIFKLMPDHVQENISNAHKNRKHYQDQKYQYLSDYISGMNDRYAVYLWSQLFDPKHLYF
jgi:dGTPase